MLVRKLTNRREFLRLSALGTAGAAIVVACAPTPSPTPTAAPKPAEAPKPTTAPAAAAPAPTTAPAAKPTEAPKPTAAPTVAPAAKPAASGQKVTIRLSPGNQPEFPPDSPYLMYWLKPFLDTHPNVELVTEGYGSEAEVKLVTQLLAGDPVHIWNTTRWGTLGRAVELKAVLDLSDYVKTWDYSVYKPSCLKVGQITGKQWAMPYGDVCDAFVTRKSIFEQTCQKIGFDPKKAYEGTWTWEDDFEKVIAAMSAPPDKYGMASMGTAKNSLARWWFQCMTQAWGYDIVADDGKGSLAATFVTPGSLEVAKMYQRGIKQKFIPRDSVTWGFDEASNAWFAGTVYTIIAGRWIKQNAEKNLKDDFISIAIPISKGRPKDSWYAGNLHISFIITKSIKDDATRDTCLELVKALVSKKVQEDMAKSGAVPFPVRTDIDPEKLYNEPYWPGMLNSFKTKTPPPTFPSHPKLEDVYTEISKAIGQLMAEPDSDPKAILETSQKKAEVLLKT